MSNFLSLSTLSAVRLLLNALLHKMRFHKSQADNFHLQSSPTPTSNHPKMHHSLFVLAG